MRYYDQSVKLQYPPDREGKDAQPKWSGLVRSEFEKSLDRPEFTCDDYPWRP